MENYVFCVVYCTQNRAITMKRDGNISHIAAQKMKFSIKDFFSKFDQILSFLWIWSLKISLMENFIFCAVLFHYLCCTSLGCLGDKQWAIV